MENYQMNRSGCRPYNRTCGMMKPSNSSTPNCPCSSRSQENMYDHLKHLVPAMAYVPYQNFTSSYDLDYALSVGTIFPQLCKPFCGKRGVRRWWKIRPPSVAACFSRSMKSASLSTIFFSSWILTRTMRKPWHFLKMFQTCVSSCWQSMRRTTAHWP